MRFRVDRRCASLARKLLYIGRDMNGHALCTATGISAPFSGRCGLQQIEWLAPSSRGCTRVSTRSRAQKRILNWRGEEGERAARLRLDNDGPITEDQLNARKTELPTIH